MYKLFNSVAKALMKSEEAIDMLALSELKDFLDWCSDGCEMCSKNDIADMDNEYEMFSNAWNICYKTIKKLNMIEEV